ncbi:MAG: hypothetical protein V7K40_14665 [Nostoc sp.]
MESVLKGKPNHTGLNYLKSPDFYFPTRESLGSVLLAKGDYRKFKKYPHYGRSLFGLQALGKHEAAQVSCQSRIGNGLER